MTKTKKFEKVWIYGPKTPLTIDQFTHRVGVATMTLVVFATMLVSPWWGQLAAFGSFAMFAWLAVDGAVDRVKEARWGR